jgi:hypothetical protein
MPCWLAKLTRRTNRPAPNGHLWFEHSGHTLWVAGSGRFVQAIEDTVLAQGGVFAFATREFLLAEQRHTLRQAMRFHSHPTDLLSVQAEHYEMRVLA